MSRSFSYAAYTYAVWLCRMLAAKRDGFKTHPTACCNTAFFWRRRWG